MSTPILATKLYAPPPRPGVVLRPRLIERLNEGLDRRLTLISAPAGSGKTRLLGEWLTALPRRAAWLSLDEGDGDPTRFLAYLVAALQTISADIGEGVLSVLQSPRQPPPESILTALLNEIATLPEDFVLVLDDYHAVGSGAVDDALAFLLEHLPPRMHLVIATREDPDLPLARLRAGGQLTELRARDLRFTPSETGEFLNRAMGLSLSFQDIAVLETRTEGWIAGLQLAAISMRGREDVAGFIRVFAGDNRYIVDYLVEEVLQRQPERVRSFLLETSILDRLSGPLCDAVTEREDGGVMLGALERGNLFVVGLDDRGHWHRYHHLFADVLRARLMEERPGRASTLHRRAGEWYEQKGLQADAIRHALAAGDFERAASLAETVALEMLGSGQEETLFGWLEALPDELVRFRPLLSVYYAFASLGHIGLEAAEARLRDAERWLDTTADTSEQPASSGEMVVVDRDGYRSLPGTIAVARAYIVGARGDVRGTLRHARRAVDLLPEDDHLWRGAADALLGIAYWTSGDLEAAHRSFVEGVAHQQMAGHTRFQIVGTHILADIRIAQGRLREAVRTYERSLRLATEHGEPVWGTANLYVGLSELHCEQGDLEAATEFLTRSKELGEHFGLPETRYRWYVAMARIKDAQGDLDGALDLLDEAERQYVENPDPDVRPVAAIKVRVWIRQGRLGEAADWAREQNLSPDDDLAYLREFEHITLARLLMARCEKTEHSVREAMGFLDRLLEAAEEGGRIGSVIEILALRAVVLRAQGNMPDALAELDRALALAEPEGYVRIFADEGTPMSRLLAEAAARGMRPEYAEKLLAFFDFDFEENRPRSSLTGPLSGRELEVLRLIERGLSNREIGEKLFLAVITVKGHNRSIFRKLDVRRRTEAVARARELGVL